MPQPHQRCGTCNAWMAEIGQVGQNRPGYCRANPPVAFPVQTVGKPLIGGNGQPQMQISYGSAFPSITEQGWCRSWRPEGYLTEEDVAALARVPAGSH